MKKTCDDCKGVGLIKCKPWVCTNCTSLKNCCHICEGFKMRGNYKECNRCWGGGQVYINKTTNKETFVPYYKK